MQNVECRVQSREHSTLCTPHSAFKNWGCSSVGRAVALQAIGREFESPQLHQHLSAERECRMQNAKFTLHPTLLTLHSSWACSSVG
jgi:hypothetical protein